MIVIVRLCQHRFVLHAKDVFQIEKTWINMSVIKVISAPEKEIRMNL
jgi:hypothetical protein